MNRRRIILDPSASAKRLQMRNRVKLATMKQAAAALAAILGASAQASPSRAAESFHKLTGAQIQARFAGMEMSDGVHVRDLFERNGTLKSLSMGKQRTGTWRIDKNALCIELGKDTGGCYQVWLSGTKVEFRRDGLDGSLMEGTLQRPSGR
jgi:hypothetical protein